MAAPKNSTEVRGMEMSLDDYIKQSGLYTSPMLKQLSSKTSASSDVELFKSTGRKHYDNDEDEDEDVVMIKAEPENETIEEGFDLRKKITGIVEPLNQSQTVQVQTPKVNSQQWRLMEPNKGQNRPAGMPPLVSASAETQFTAYKLNKRPDNTRELIQNNYNCNGNNNRKQQYRRNNNNWNYNNNGGRNYNKNGKFNNYNNGQMQRQNNNWRNNNNHIGPYTIPRQNNTINPLLRYNNVGACNIMIEADSTKQYDLNGSMSSLPESILTPKHPPIVLDPTPVTTLTADNFKEIMPMMASKFLEILQSNTVHKPKYDMQVQKEIHQLQKKPMFYKCPGGEIVSSDGKGINVNVPVRSTGISLNNRFA